MMSDKLFRNLKNLKAFNVEKVPKMKVEILKAKQSINEVAI